MKNSKVLLTTTLLGILAGVVGCGGNNSSSNSSTTSTAISSSTVITSSSSSSSSTVISSSSEAAVPTEALTQEMFSGLQGGYAANFVKSTDYDGAGGSAYIVEAKVNEKNYAFKRYSTVLDDNGNYQKNIFVEESHYQINPSEEEEWLYNAGLSIGNTVIYSPVMGRDKYSFQEIELTWEEGGYSNVFALLTIGDFTRVGDENKWALNVNDSALEAAGVYRMLASQFFGEEVEADIDHFYLLTNGDKITGFDLRWKTYLSYESYVTKFAFGTFEGFGADVTSFVTLPYILLPREEFIAVSAGLIWCKSLPAFLVESLIVVYIPPDSDFGQICSLFHSFIGSKLPSSRHFSTSTVSHIL